MAVGLTSALFQYQLSAIEGDLAMIQAKIKASFNTSLVQLKVVGGLALLATGLGFNTSLVQLKVGSYFAR